jgi:L-iditol 2-dehydrogenase
VTDFGVSLGGAGKKRTAGRRRTTGRQGILTSYRSLLPSAFMRALVATAPGEVALRDLPVPEAGPGDVVVRVEAALTCGTDLKLIRRGHPKVPFPVVLGHELAGVVSQSGAGAAFEVGTRVATTVTGPCGHCPECVSEHENLCRTAFEEPVWGAFAEYVRIPSRVVARGLAAIPAGLSFPAAALLDPVASVLRGLSRVPVGPRTRMLVMGAGPIAFLFAILARHLGAGAVIVAGRKAGRLSAIRSSGVITVDVTCESLQKTLREATGQLGPDVVVDTTGDAGVVADLLELVSRGGTLLVFAGMPGKARLDLLAARIHYDEVTVAGSFHYRPSDAGNALELLSRGVVPLDRIVTSVRPLEDYADVLDAMVREDGMKTCFAPST